jgi:hypothetical protein
VTAPESAAELAANLDRNVIRRDYDKMKERYKSYK